MNKYALPPRAEFANRVLISINILGYSLMPFAKSEIDAEAVVMSAVRLALIVGLILRHPLAYGLIMVACFFVIVLALDSYNMVVFVVAAIQLAVVMYIRNNLHALRVAALKE